MASIRNKSRSPSPKEKVMQKANDQLRNDIASARLIAQNLQNQNLSKVTEDKVKSFLSITKDLQQGKGTFTSKDLANLESLRSSLDDAAEQMLAVNKNFQYELSDIFDNYFSIVNDNTYSVSTRNQKFEELKKIVSSGGGDLSHVKSRSDLVDPQTYRGIQDQLKGKTISAVKLSKVSPTSIFSNENSQDRRLLRRAANRVRSATLGGIKEAGSFALQGALGAAFGAAGLGHIDSHFGVSTRLHQYTSDKLSDMFSKNKDPYESITYDRFDNADKTRSFRLLENFMAPQPASGAQPTSPDGKKPKRQRKPRQSNSAPAQAPVPQPSQDVPGVFRTRITNVRMKNGSADPITVLREIVSTNKDINSTLMGTNSKLDELITSLSPGHRQDLHGFDRRIGNSEDKSVSKTDTVTKSDNSSSVFDSVKKKLEGVAEGWGAKKALDVAKNIFKGGGSAAVEGAEAAAPEAATGLGLGTLGALAIPALPVAGLVGLGIYEHKSPEEEAKLAKQMADERLRHSISMNPSGYYADEAKMRAKYKRLGIKYDYSRLPDSRTKDDTASPSPLQSQDYSQLKDSRTKDDVPKMLDGYSHVRGSSGVNGIEHPIDEYHDQNDKVVSRERAYGLVGPEQARNSSPVSVQPITQATVQPSSAPQETPNSLHQLHEQARRILGGSDPVPVVIPQSRPMSTAQPQTQGLNSVVTTIRNLDDTLQQLIQVLRSGVAMGGGGAMMGGSNAGGGSASSGGGSSGGGGSGSLGPMTYTNTPKNRGSGGGASGGDSSPSTPSLTPEQTAKLTESNGQLSYAQAQASLHGEDPSGPVMKGIQGQIDSNNAKLSGGGGGSTGPSAESDTPGKQGQYRPVRDVTSRDTDDDVVNTIAGEARLSDPKSVDAVINNMYNRLGTKAYGPSKDLHDVARARGQYAGYNSKISDKQREMIRSRIKAIGTGSVPDITHGANVYRAGWYGTAGHEGYGKTFSRRHVMGDNPAPVIGGNRFAYEPEGGKGTYAPYDVPKAGTDSPMTGGGGDSGGGGATTNVPNPSAAAPKSDRVASNAGQSDVRQKDLDKFQPRVNESTEQLAERIKKFSPGKSGEECVALAQNIAGMKGTVRDWRRGEGVEAGKMVAGTPIATFMDRHGKQSDKYDGGEGVGIHARDSMRLSGLGAGTTHAMVFNAYDRDKNGKITGFSAYEQWKGSGGPRLTHYNMDDRRGGEKAGRNFYSIRDAQGAPIGSRNPENPQSGAVATASAAPAAGGQADTSINSPANKALAARSAVQTGSETQALKNAGSIVSTNNPSDAKPQTNDLVNRTPHAGRTLMDGLISQRPDKPADMIGGYNDMAGMPSKPENGFGRLLDRATITTPARTEYNDMNGFVAPAQQQSSGGTGSDARFPIRDTTPVNTRDNPDNVISNGLMAQRRAFDAGQGIKNDNTVGYYRKQDGSNKFVPVTSDPADYGHEGKGVTPQNVKPVNSTPAANMYKAYDTAPVKDKAPVAPAQQKAVPLPPERPITSSEMDTAQLRRHPASPSSDGHHKKKPNKHISDVLLHALNQRMFHHHST